jgi:RNA polymerase sigma factor (sigma-70 family)
MPAAEAPHVASRAVDDLYRQYRAEIYRYAYAVVGNHADAEDVTQTTFLNAYRALEEGVRPRKPPNWLLTIASNAIKQRFRQERARPRQVELDEHIAGTEADDEGPSIGELLTALSKIPPQQRQAIVLREFEGRSYREIAHILGTTTTALETLLFRARRRLAEELEQQLTCMGSQLAISKAVDGRLGRKERRRLRDHLAECPDCAHFARVQPRHRSALRGLVLIPIPLSLSLVKGLEGAGTATAATVSVAAGDGGTTTAASTGLGSGFGTAGTAGGSAAVGGLTFKAASVVVAVTLAGGVAVTGAVELAKKHGAPPVAASKTARPPAHGAVRSEAADVVPREEVIARERAHGAGDTTASGRRAVQMPVNPYPGEVTESSAPENDEGGTNGGTDQPTTQPEIPANEPQGTVPQPNQPQESPPSAPSQPAPAPAPEPKNDPKSKQPKKSAQHKKAKPEKQPKVKQRPKSEKQPEVKQQPKPENQPKPHEPNPKSAHEPKKEQGAKPQQPTSSTTAEERSAPGPKPANDKAGGSKS